MRACLLHCMHVQLRNGYTQAYAQIMQNTPMLGSFTKIRTSSKIIRIYLVGKAIKIPLKWVVNQLYRVRNAPGHNCLVRACLLHCMHVQLRNGYTQAYAQIMQNTPMAMHKAVTGRVEAKKLLSRWRQSTYSTNRPFLNKEVMKAL